MTNTTLPPGSTDIDWEMEADMHGNCSIKESWMCSFFSHRWLNATKYIHSSTVVYLRGTCTLLGYVHFLPPYTSEAYILLFTTRFYFAQSISTQWYCYFGSSTRPEYVFHLCRSSNMNSESSFALNRSLRSMWRNHINYLIRWALGEML